MERVRISPGALDPLRRRNAQVLGGFPPGERFGNRVQKWRIKRAPVLDSGVGERGGFPGAECGPIADEGTLTARGVVGKKFQVSRHVEPI